MTEFLTENSRRAYPLEREWPAELRERWAGTLVDACVYTAADPGDGRRISLLSVRRSGSSLVFTVGVAGSAGLDVVAESGRRGFVTACAMSDAVKAILTFDAQKVTEVALDDGCTEDECVVDVPFAARCAGGATRGVTAVTVQGSAMCETPVYSPSDPNRVERSVSAGEHAVLRAGDGVDLEVTGVMPLVGSVLRVSAIASPEATYAEDDPVDMMIRGDACFSVEAEPGVKVRDGAIVPRTADDRPGGVIRVGSTCKPCCQCEDYKDAVDLLRPAETSTLSLNELLDGVKAEYDRAVAAFDTAKEEIIERVNSVDNVHVTATAVPSCNIYGGSDAKGTRQRIAVTFLAENMTMTDAVIYGTAINVDGFSLHSATGATEGSMSPGGTLMAVLTYAKPETTANAVTAMPGISVTCTVQVGNKTGVKTINVT